MAISKKQQLMKKATMYFYAGVVASAIGYFAMESVLPLGWLLFLVTGYYYGQAKGYSSLVGGALGFLGALGLGILLFMPEKNAVAGEPVNNSSDTNGSQHSSDS